MKINEIKNKIRKSNYVFTHHADVERKADDLAFYQIEEALLTGEILEDYADAGLGESCLILGFSENIPIHVVCGYRGEKIAIITVYIPGPPKFKDPWTRGKKNNEEN